MLRKRFKEFSRKTLAATLLATTLLSSFTAFAEEQSSVEAATKPTFEVIIQDDPDCKMTSEKLEYEAGDKVTIDVDKNMYFEFQGVQVSGVESEEDIEFQNTHTSLTFKMPAEDVTVKAVGFNLRGDISAPTANTFARSAVEILSSEDYLMKYVDKNYVPNPSTPQASELLPLKHTITESGAMTFHEALAAENAQYLYPTEHTVTMFDMDSDSEYYVAFIDSMRWTEGASVVDYAFAYSNLNGESIEDVVYDKASGIAYIPKAYTTENKEGAGVGNITGQLLYQVPDSAIEKAVHIENKSDVDGVYSSSEFTTSYFSVTTIAPIADPGTEIEKVSLYLNGVELREDEFMYDSENGTIFINAFVPTAISLDVVVGEAAPKTKQARVAEAWYWSATDAPWLFSQTPTEGEWFLIEGQTIVQYNISGSWGEEPGLTPGLSLPYHASMSGDPNLENFYNNILHGNLDGLDDFETYEEARAFITQLWDLGSGYREYESNMGTTLSFDPDTFKKIGLKCIHVDIPFGDPDGYVDGMMTAQNQNVGIRIIDASHVNDANPYIIVGIVSTNHNARDPYNDYDQQGAGVFKMAVAPSNGTASLKKASSNPEMTNGNSCYSLAGATYGIFSDSAATKQVGTLTTDANGNTNKVDLTAGRYYVKELTAPKGYMLDTTVYPIDVEAGKDEVLNVQDIPMDDPIAVLLKKQDADLLTDEQQQGSASLQGAQYTFRYYPVLLDDETVDPVTEGHAAAKEWVFETNENGFLYFSEAFLVSGDDFYYGASGAVSMPLGTLTVQETKAPEGYLLNDELFVRQIKEDAGLGVIPTYNIPVSEEEIMRGGVSVAKMDIETDTAQGAATLEGAEIAIVNMNENPVIVNGASYANGETVLTLTTDADGNAATANDVLPYGEYLAREVKSPEGYLILGETERSFAVVADGEMVDLTTDSTAIKDNVIRGGLEVAKYDIELDTNEPQGGATLQGAQFEIISRNEKPVLVDGVLYGENEVVKTILTDENGIAKTEDNTLPYGDYTVSEIKAPNGYLLEGILWRDVTVNDNGVFVDMTTTDTAIKNEIIRGDLELVKIADGTMARLANVPFKITNTTSGESHIIVTDENGYASTSSEWNLHSNNTNRGEENTDGVWFGAIDALKDTRGALPYGSYTIEELPCESNEGFELFAPFTITINRNNHVVNLGTLTNDLEVKPELKTSAYDAETGNKVGEFGVVTTITDVVEYENVKPGTYTMEGVLMDKTTGTEFLVDGKPVTATKEFTVEEGKPNGSISLDFVFDGTSLDESHTLVVFERMYDVDGELAGEHTDINSSSQTVIFKPAPKPLISTTAIDKETGEKVTNIKENLTITDEVMYENIEPGTYTMEGILMDKATGEELLVNGERVTATKEFTVEEGKPSGSVFLDFEIKGLTETTAIVVFETMLDADGNVVAEHKDIESVDQTVTYIEPDEPYIGTEAVDKDSNTHVGTLGEKNTIVDTVYYYNLEKGKEYKLEGVLMDKATNKPLIVDGKEVTAERTFLAEDVNGSTTIEFAFDGTFLEDGVEIVVFETLIDVVIDEEGNEKDEVVAEHKDIEDENQTVTYTEEAPSIGTVAIDKESGTREAYFSESNTIIDKVIYKGLVQGETYHIEGILMDKATGQPLLVDGKTVTASKSFVAMGTAGEVDMEFTFNGSKIPHDTQIVVFETLYNEQGIKIAEHTDINDEKQTVSYEVEKPFIEQLKTGDAGAIGILVAGVATTLITMVGAAMFLLKKKKSHFSI